MKAIKILFMAMLVLATCLTVSHAQNIARPDSSVKVAIAPKAILNTHANQLVINTIATNLVTNETVVVFSLDTVAATSGQVIARRKLLYHDNLRFVTSTDFPSGVTVSAVKAKLAIIYGLVYP